MIMGFRDWLDIQENGTCTASVAFFARPMLPLVRRTSPMDFLSGVEDFLGGILDVDDDKEDKPKKKKKSEPKKKKSKKKDD